MVFMAMARVVWASSEMEPYDMAPVTKRFTISLAGSTCTHIQCQPHCKALPELKVQDRRITTSKAKEAICQYT